MQRASSVAYVHLTRPDLSAPPQDLPRPVATTLGFDVESRRAGSTDCGSAATSGAARREVGVSNGHSRESSCEQSGRGAFVS